MRHRYFVRTQYGVIKIKSLSYIIISAQRLSPLVDSDQILVLQQGTILSQGTHQQLIAKPGSYRDMHSYQQIEASLENEHE